MKLVRQLALSVACGLPGCVSSELPEECDGHEKMPGGCKCYFDPLNLDCPTSISADGQVAMCSCEYNDNNWLHVMTRYMKVFRASEQERMTMASDLKIRMEAEGVLSMQVGYSENGVVKRVECGAPLVETYPGTNFQVDMEEVDKFARNLMWPQVRQKLNELCLPGRVALSMLCLHAELGRKNAAAVEGYAKQLVQMIPKIAGCIDNHTPWPMPAIEEYGRTLKAMLDGRSGSVYKAMAVGAACPADHEPVSDAAECDAGAVSIGHSSLVARIGWPGYERFLPENLFTGGCYFNENGLWFNAYGVPGKCEPSHWPDGKLHECHTICKKAVVGFDGSMGYAQVSALTYWPDPGKIRGKRPEEAESHYWPCAPLQDVECFPSGTQFSQQSCESCCDPGVGPTGDTGCFDSVFTFARCCRTPNDQGRFW